VFNKLFIISGIFPPDPGGPAKFAYEFSGWSDQNGVDVKVISYVDEVNSNSPNPDRKFLGISRKNNLLFRYFKMMSTISKSVQDEDRVIAVGAFLEIYIASIVKRIKYVAKVPGDIVWERARNNKVTELDINDYQESKLPTKYRFFRYLFTRSLKRASLVIVPSSGLFQLCIQWGIPESRLRIIQNSVDLSKFSTLKRDSFKFDVLTVCRLAPWKGVDELIEVCARHKLTLAVAGDGPERANLERLGAKLGLNVNFFGDVSEHRILELLSSSKIFVLNSHYEGLPHALVEARAAGMISVARGGTGSAEVIQDMEDGFLVGEKLSLSKAVAMAIREFDSSNRMGELAAIDTRERFDRERGFEKISHVLREYNS
jgi:glycosyltransferase involved in cell wall biosynthesis